jgi:hypothetical protein
MAQMHQCLAAVLATAQKLARLRWLILLAKVAGHAGQIEGGLRLLAEALARLEASGRGDWLGGVRFQDAFLQRRATREIPQAETCFQQALTIARRQ